MKILRIIDKETGMFKRDDFEFIEGFEEGLDVEPAQGFYGPKWDGTGWVEGFTAEQIAEIQNQPEYLDPNKVMEDLIALLIESGVISNV